MVYSGWEFESLSKVSNYYRWISSEFRKYFEYSNFTKWNALEYGCGSGNFAKFVGPWIDDFYLFEPNENSGRIVWTGAFRDIQANSIQLVPKRSVDGAFCVNVLEHVENQEASLIEMHSCLKDNGFLFLFVPAHQGLYGSLDEVFGHHRRYDRKELRKLVTSCRFRVIKAKYFNMFGAILWFVAGRILKKRSWSVGGVSVYDKFVIPFLRIVEPRNPPFGQSLLLVAKKSTSPLR